ncbi:MAG: acyl-CoA thioesterase [Firmicutes bacterium]|jgi:acyl-CoA thioester hydrolase|nr:acyl-CoA thioesterase [Bacillota bacterium]
MEKIEDLKDKLKLFRFSTEVRVRMPETDVMGIVFHGTFFIYMEVGRMEYLRSLNLSEPGRPIKGFHNLVKKASCEFESPVRFDDLISIYTRVSDMGWSSFRFEFLMVNQQNSLLAAKGESIHVAVDDTTWRPMSIPESFRRTIQTYERGNLHVRD